MANVGKLTVELAASVAKFQADLGKAASFAESASKRMTSALSAVRGTVAGLAGAITVGAFVNLVKGSVDAADHLNDLSKQTGIAVDTLGGIGFAAEQSGGSLEDAAASISKFNLKIAEAISGEKDAVKAFEALGISVDELKNKTTDDILVKVADRFASYDDHANTAALANAVFGKSYAGFLPLLREGGDSLLENIDYFRRFGGITQETAGQADKFNDTMAKLKLLNGQFGRALASELLPSLQTLAGLWVENQEKSSAFAVVAQDVAGIIKGLSVVALTAANAFSTLGRYLGASTAASKAFLSGDFKGAKFINDEFLADTERRLKEYEKLRDAILFGTEQPGTKRPSGAKPAGGGQRAPSLVSASGADDAARKILDGQLKALESVLRAEQDVLKDREHFLQRYYQDDQIATREYYQTRQELIRDALDKEVALYDQEIAALQAFAAKASPKDRVDAEAKIADVVGKRAKAQQDASIKSVNLFLDEEKAAAQFLRKLEDVALTIAQLRGDQATAAAFGFDLQNAEWQKRIDLKKRSTDDQSRRSAELLDQKLAELRTLTVQQASLNQTQQDFGFILDEVAIAQERVNILRDSGAITELDALARLSQANKARIGELSEVAAKYREIAEASGDKRAMIAAEQMELAIERMAATTDLIALKFNQIGASSFSQLLQDLVSGKDPLQSLKDFGADIAGKITTVVADNLAQQAFGKDGIFGGFGELFSGLFGGVDSGAVALTGSATALSGSAAALTASAAALSASAAASTASSFGSGFGNLFDIFGGGGDILTGLQGFAAGG
ncbi:MAG: hypothetical protein IPM64_18140, partial [Phycisphaerales bacterium]|nr:hypothetical protein [Phycisphaerales bacterium]